MDLTPLLYPFMTPSHFLPGVSFTFIFDKGFDQFLGLTVGAGPSFPPVGGISVTASGTKVFPLIPILGPRSKCL